MKLSVIIPCYNAAETIATQLKALANQRWAEPWEVIVSDNGSTDESLAIVERNRARLPDLKIVNASARRGAAYAKNIGARAATGDALVFCDADDEVAPGWVAAIGKALSIDDFVASRFDTKKLNMSLIQKYIGNPQQNGFQALWYPPYLPHSGGCGLGVRRSLHETVGGFDESLLALEDTDYCIRIQLTGAKLHFVPDAVVHIRYRAKLSGIYRQSRLWAKYNLLMYKKYRFGMRMPQPWLGYLKDWMHLLRSLPQICYGIGRANWAWRFGRQIGRLQGIIKYRVPPV